MAATYTMKWKYVFGGIIVAEICIVAYLGHSLYVRLSQSKIVLGTATVTPINKEYLIFQENSRLRYFYEPKPNSVQTEHPDWLPYAATYTINSDSLNERYNYAVDKPSDTYRVLVLGDSFTFGEFVNTTDNWPEQLENKLNTDCGDSIKYEVINLGVYGYDMEYAVERYRLRGTKYQPDLVLWLLLGERMNEYMTPIIQELEISMPTDKRAAYAAKGNYSPEWSEATTRMLQTFSPQQRLEQERAFMKQFTNIYDGPLVLFTPPNLGFEYRVRVKLHASERPNTYYTDSIPDIIASGQVLPDGHPNTSGHTSYAKYMFNKLAHFRLVPCLPTN